jgi:Putative Actinobacterial Holin-X, holin superfamily III
MLTRTAERVATHARRMVQLEIELAMLEIRRKLTALGSGVGVLVAAAVVVFFMVAFVLATIAAALATALPVWLATLIVAAGLGLVAAGLAVLGSALLKRGTPPVPELALREAELTTEALRNGRG